MIHWVHPALFFFIGAAALPFLDNAKRKLVQLGVPLLSLLSLYYVSPGTHGVVPLMGQELIFGRVDNLSLVFGFIFGIIGFIGMLYGFHLKTIREHIAAFVYAGGAMGAVFAGDLFTLFLFWEIMSFSSVFIIWFGGYSRSAGAGLRYLLIHTFGGVMLLGGIIVHVVNTGDIGFTAIPLEGWAGGLMLFGFLVNAGGPPLHAWLPDAYPEGSVTGTIWLATFTTKVAVYTLVRGFPGAEILIYAGLFMTLFGVGMTILENDVRRLLSYHIISQVGYMVTAVGVGTELALNGAVAHAINNILFKGLLMMGMGSVIYMTGKRKATELGGLGKVMPITAALYMIGGFSISGVPLFNGFISKGMIISGAAEAHRPVTTLLLTLAASGTFLSTTLKLPFNVFAGRDKKLKVTDPPPNMIIGMSLAAILCFLLGVQPHYLTALLPFPEVEYHAFTTSHLVIQFQILVTALIAFLIFVEKLRPHETISLDTDWFYRKGGHFFMKLAKGPISIWEEFIIEVYKKAIIRPTKGFIVLCRRFDIGVIDRIVNEIGRGVFGGGWFSNAFEKYVVYALINVVGYFNHIAAHIFKRLQTGSVHNYAMIIIVGIFILVNLYMLIGEQLTQLMVAVK
ncbi:MAG: Na(+)/H(+) antiporter subunit D [Nitrospiria bacterium]